MSIRRSNTIPLLFTIAAVTTLTALGAWQLQRLAWKTSLIHDIEQAQQMPPLETLDDGIGQYTYRKVKLTGTFTDKTIHLVGRMQDQELGYFMLTPFTLPDGKTVLVNRGFAPPEKDNLPEGEYTLEGIIRPLREKRYFAPENQPEKNLWFYEDIHQLSNHFNTPLLPAVVEVTGQKKHGVYPVPGDGKILLRNDHLGYAVTWFLLAATSVVMYCFYRKKKPA